MGRLLMMQFVIFLLLLAISAPLTYARRQDVEEVTKRQLDSLLKTEDYLAVFWGKFQ